MANDIETRAVVLLRFPVRQKVRIEKKEMVNVARGNKRTTVVVQPSREKKPWGLLLLLLLSHSFLHVWVRYTIIFLFLLHLLFLLSSFGRFLKEIRIIGQHNFFVWTSPWNCKGGGATGGAT